jgi:hypothetical protein
MEAAGVALVLIGPGTVEQVLLYASMAKAYHRFFLRFDRKSW